MLSGCEKKESDDMFVLDQEKMSIQGEVQNSELGKKMKVPQSIDCKMKTEDRKSTRLNSSHEWISYADFCLKK